MEALEILTRLETLLSEEREAIARLDGVAVDAFAREKRSLAEALERRPADERARHGEALRRVASTLKANGVLLAQARALLSDFLLGPGASGSGRPSSRVPVTTVRAPRRVSVRG